jgi:phosphopantothenoylcysteine synthetase/decarboxylase
MWEQLHIHAHYVAPAIVSLTSKISYLFIPNFTHNTETATAKGGKLLIATHLDQSNYLVN